VYSSKTELLLLFLSGLTLMRLAVSTGQFRAMQGIPCSSPNSGCLVVFVVSA
jgi:hypothetical protein